MAPEPFEVLRARLRQEVAKGTVAGAAHAVRGRVVATVAEGKANGKAAFQRFFIGFGVV